MRRWEKFFKECIIELSKEKIILDVGSGKPFQKELKKFENLFKGCQYYSLDINIAYKPHIVGDIHNLPFKDESIDAIICKAVLEHVPEPQKAVREMYRVLRKGGKIFVYIPFIYPYHGGNYKDYYRFTIDAIEYMFSDFKELKVVPVRGLFGTLSLFIPKIGHILEQIANIIDEFIYRLHKGSGYKNLASGYNIFAIK